MMKATTSIRLEKIATTPAAAAKAALEDAVMLDVEQPHPAHVELLSSPTEGRRLWAVTIHGTITVEDPYPPKFDAEPAEAGVVPIR